MTGDGGGRAALAGFEYQLDVSLFFALRTLLITKVASRITLEPDNEEDLEADLDQSRVEPHAHFDGADHLVVQVKLRNSEPWSARAFATLLGSGKRRKAAIEHLASPTTRFLLVTNADVARSLKGLCVEAFDERAVGRVPANLSRALPTLTDGQVAIFASLSVRQLSLEINETLQALLHVPAESLEACRTALREDASRRMRGHASGTWTREDLIGVITRFGGAMASAPDLEEFVPPSNFPAMRAALEAHGAVVIAGPSGSGKTWAALKLCDEARMADGRRSLKVLDPSAGPAAARMAGEGGPAILYLEDPWGQYSLSSDTQTWSTQLPALLRQAHLGRQYVITTRSDLLERARVGETLARWTVILDAENYVDGEMAAIYDSRVQRLPAGQQMLAYTQKGSALERLRTPLELDRFFNALEEGAQAETQTEFLQRAYKHSQRDAVEADLHGYLDDLAAPQEAAILWALLATHGQIGRAQLQSVQQALRRQPGYAPGLLVKLAERLVATRHLRQPGQLITFRHPSVRQALESYLRARPYETIAAWEDLQTVMTAMASDWAIETAARSLVSIYVFPEGLADGVVFLPPADALSAIDQWFDRVLIEPNAAFADLLELAASCASVDSVAGETARLLLRRVQRGGAIFDDNWTPYEVEEARLTGLSGLPLVRAIIDRFIREMLPKEDDYYRVAMIEEWRRLAGDLTDAFLAAAQTVVDQDSHYNAQIIAAGAAADLDRFAPMALAALDRLERDAQVSPEDEDLGRRVREHEVDEAFAEDFGNDGYMEGVASREIVAAYVAAVRRDRGWRDLALHPRVNELARAWADDVLQGRGERSPDELAALLDACRAAGVERDAWKTLALRWTPSMRPHLVQRLAEGTSDHELLISRVHCALRNVPQVIGERLSAAPDGEAVHLVVALNMAARRYGVRASPRRVGMALRAAPPDMIELLMALPVNKHQARAVCVATARRLWAAADEAPVEILDDIVNVLIASSQAPTAIVSRWLREATGPDEAKQALAAAVRLEAEDLIVQSLHHPFADVRAAALDQLSKGLTTPAPPDVLAMAADRSSIVRRRLVAALLDRPNDDHLSVLLALLDDTWSNAERHHDEAPHYQIAHDALRALDRFPSLPTEIGDVLLTLGEATEDPDLRDKAFMVAARRFGPDVRRRLWTFGSGAPGGWNRIGALEALAQSEVLEPEILRRITPDLIARLSPAYAIAFVRVFSAHALRGAVMDMADSIAVQPERKALLLVMADRLKAFDDETARAVMARLPAAHPAQALLDGARRTKLPAQVLDDLGDVRLRLFVTRRLSEDIDRS